MFHRLNQHSVNYNYKRELICNRQSNARWRGKNLNKETIKMAEVQIRNTLVGDSHPCYVVAEIGINHNGDIDMAKRIIDIAIAAGCNAVKFQKRTIEIVYSE